MRNLLIVLLIASTATLSGQTKATTTKGENVLLFDNGTWETSGSSNNQNTSFNQQTSCSELTEVVHNNRETVGLSMMGNESFKDYIGFKGIKTDDDLLLIFICGEQIKCVSKKAYILFEFENGKQLRIANNSSFNCDGRFSFSLNTQRSNMRYFSGESIQKIKLVNGRKSIQQKLEESVSIEIMDKINCLLEE